VTDHHVDRPEVHGRQRPQPTGTNRSSGLILSLDRRPMSQDRRPGQTSLSDETNPSHAATRPRRRQPLTGCAGDNLSKVAPRRHSPLIPDPAGSPLVFRRPGGHGEGQDTRSHPELGRENPLRRWYCVSRRGRVGRRQARQRPDHTAQASPITASPAHDSAATYSLSTVI
jgi:hypothetical protein